MNKKNGRELPLSTVRLVAAYCGDYPRMKSELKRRELPEALYMSYQVIVTAIFTETASACGLAGAQVEELIDDISRNRGYRASQLNKLTTRVKFYRAKAKATRGIAERLFLI